MKYTIKFLALAVCLLMQASSYSVTNTSPSPSPQMQVKPMESNQPEANKPQQHKLTPVRHGPLIAPAVKDEKIVSIYASPGIAGLVQGKWVGNDHMMNLSSSLNIVVEIVHPLEVTTTLTEASVVAKITQLLQGAGLRPLVNFIQGGSPLPFLHYLIMIQPVEGGYATFVSMRLFENVTLTRTKLKLNYPFQAITWEKQELLFLPANALEFNILATIERMTNGFAGVFKNSQVQAQGQGQLALEL